MSKKTTRTFSISKDNDEFLARHDNASALVDDLVEQYRNGADRDTVALQLQMNQKRREKELAKDRVDRLDNDIQELKELADEFSTEESAEIREAANALANTPDDTENPAVQNWAQKLSMTPEKLLTAIDSIE